MAASRHSGVRGPGGRGHSARGSRLQREATRHAIPKCCGGLCRWLGRSGHTVLALIEQRGAALAGNAGARGRSIGARS
eukprot:1498734-Alexandrium_andersonii.AAC.1